MYKSIKPHKLTEALEYVRQGGTLYVFTYPTGDGYCPAGGRKTVIDTKTLAKFEKAGQWLLKEDGGRNGDRYRLRTGRTSVTLFKGQLKYDLAEAVHSAGRRKGETMIVLAMMCDPDGIPRAWAGAATKPEAEAEARRQLEAYRAKKAKNRDPLAHASFRVVFEVFDEVLDEAYKRGGTG